jgi:ketosteroid isomerase-like protein
MPADIISIDVEILDKLKKGYVDSVQKSDVRWFDEHLAEDFLNSNPDGSIIDRAAFLAQIAKTAAIKGLEPREVKIRLFGDFAIIHAKTVYRKPDGQNAAGRYTDIWQRRNGRWLCVAAHVTRG